ncbi:MAG: hypothetical protein F4018_03955 [Acidobacteria bacterium]|nr:hypothetical protein [Acidobacteriota bacterium]MYK87552.1 hypothetical protein [Acidobacteriota bacterium]
MIANGPTDTLAGHQPSLRYFLLDHGRQQSTDLPPDNLVSALIALEAGASPAEAATATDRLIDLLAGHEDEALTEAFSAWVEVLLRPGAHSGTTPDPLTRLKEVRTMLAERVQEWTREWVQQGRAEGREQGRAAERSLLHRQAARKFDAATANRLATAIADVSDPERLSEVGEWIIDCSTGNELLERVRIICGDEQTER